MMTYKNPLFALIIIVILFAIQSCGNEESTAENMDFNNDQLEQLVDSSDQSNIAVIEEDTSWHIYFGQCGFYQQNVVMELSTSGTEVWGSYFYTQHQKMLTLKGTVDTVSNKYTIEERYKDKVTGHMVFWLKDNKIEGSWMKKLNTTDKEKLTAERIVTDVKEKKKYNPVYKRFNREHEISFYNGEEEEIMKVTDEINVSMIGTTHFAFDYHVIGRNAHLGNIDGLAIMKDKNSAVYSDDEYCELLFEFEKHLVDIKVKGECDSYGGYHAHFGGTLVATK